MNPDSGDGYISVPPVTDDGVHIGSIVTSPLSPEMSMLCLVQRVKSFHTKLMQVRFVGAEGCTIST